MVTTRTAGRQQDTTATTTASDTAAPGAKTPAHGVAADAAVKSLLARLGVGQAATTDRALTADRVADAHATPQPVSDSEIEALTPHELRALDRGLTAAIDPALVAAIKTAGGIVAFMKAMAAGQTIGGVNDAKFIQLWSTSADEAWLKDKFRAADASMHEWIPSNQIEEIVAKAKTAAGGGLWVDLQNELRSPTVDVIFNESKAKVDGPHVRLQGHVGALYYAGVMQTVQEAEFHDQLRAAFAAATSLGDCVDKLKLVMLAWIWDGSALSKSMDPGLQDSVKKPIDESAMIAGRKAKFTAMTTLFDTIKAKFVAASPAGHGSK